MEPESTAEAKAFQEPLVRDPPSATLVFLPFLPEKGLLEPGRAEAHRGAQ